MNDSLLETIQTIKQRAERLEQEASELRRELARIAEVFINPLSVVARYIIEGETYEITQSDVEMARNELAKPWTESALYELVAVKKMARKLRERSPEEQNQHFYETVEAIRAAALANGTAIDSEAEAVIGD